MIVVVKYELAFLLGIQFVSYDEYLFEKFGLRCIDYTERYEVTDEAGFSLFMLQHSEYIRWIENA